MTPLVLSQVIIDLMVGTIKLAIHFGIFLGTTVVFAYIFYWLRSDESSVIVIKTTVGVA